MSARAIWKGCIALGPHAVAVKLYAAVQDRAVHFHLLHEKDLTPVQQRIVRKDNGREVPKDAQRKALPLDDARAVILEPEELEQLEPESDRTIHVLRFLPPQALSPLWLDRPYYLGPDGDDDAFHALADALGGKQRVGVARWVMRDKRYLGALSVSPGGHLMMTTLRRAGQVLAVPAIRPDKARTPSAAEVKLAQQFVDAITAPFEPERWHNAYRERLARLIEAKAKGTRLKLVKPEPKQATGDLADSLRASLDATRQKKAA